MKNNDCLKYKIYSNRMPNYNYSKFLITNTF